MMTKFKERATPLLEQTAKAKMLGYGPVKGMVLTIEAQRPFPKNWYRYLSFSIRNT